MLLSTLTLATLAASASASVIPQSRGLFARQNDDELPERCRSQCQPILDFGNKCSDTTNLEGECREMACNGSLFSDIDTCAQCLGGDELAGAAGMKGELEYTCQNGNSNSPTTTGGTGTDPFAPTSTPTESASTSTETEDDNGTTVTDAAAGGAAEATQATAGAAASTSPVAPPATTGTATAPIPAVVRNSTTTGVAPTGINATMTNTTGPSATSVTPSPTPTNAGLKVTFSLSLVAAAACLVALF